MFRNLLSKLLRSAVPVLALFLSASCRTANPPVQPQDTTRVALVSDLHVTVGTNDAARTHPLRLALVMEAVNAANVDLVLLAGDLTEAGKPAEIAKLRESLKGFKAPVLFVPGNHDLGNKKMPNKKPTGSEITLRRLRNFERKLGQTFWVREEAGLRIIGLNSGLYGSKFAREKEMWEFLEAQLEKTNALPTLIVQHHPPFLKTLMEPGGDYFNMEPYPRMRLLAAARQGGVKAILSGHVHRGITNDYQGMLLYTTPPVAFGLPKGKQAEGWTLVTVMAKEVTAEFQPIKKVTAPALP